MSRFANIMYNSILKYSKNINKTKILDLEFQGNLKKLLRVFHFLTKI